MAEHITIATPGGPKVVRAIVRDGLALHPAIAPDWTVRWVDTETGETTVELGGPGSWTATHVRTGLAVAHLKDWRAGLRYFNDMRRNINWGFWSMHELPRLEHRYIIESARLYNGIINWMVDHLSAMPRHERSIENA